MGFEDAKFYGCQQGYEDASASWKVRKLYFALSLVIILAGVGSMVHNQSSIGCAAQLQHGVQRRYFHKRYL